MRNRDLESLYEKVILKESEMDDFELPELDPETHFTDKNYPETYGQERGRIKPETSQTRIIRLLRQIASAASDIMVEVKNHRAVENGVSPQELYSLIDSLFKGGHEEELNALKTYLISKIN